MALAPPSHPPRPHPTPCACAHVDTLSLTALYVPTRGTPYPSPPLCVYRADTQYHPTPPRTLSPHTHLHACVRRGDPGLCLSPEALACLHSSSTPSNPTRCRPLDARVRTRSPGTGVPRSPQHAGPSDILLILTLSPSWFVASKKHSRGRGGKQQKKKKQGYCWRLSRDVCWQLLCVTSLMCAWWRRWQHRGEGSERLMC